MFGKHFESMYTGSMIGAGFAAFSLMGYVIANQKPNADKTEYFVDLHPSLLHTIFGEPIEAIEKAIEFLCSPDPNSRSKADEGRRLVRVGPFTYRSVNGAAYARIRDEYQRREQNRLAQQRHRSKLKQSTPTKAAQLYEQAFIQGQVDESGQPQPSHPAL